MKMDVAGVRALEEPMGLLSDRVMPHQNEAPGDRGRWPIPGFGHEIRRGRPSSEVDP